MEKEFYAADQKMFSGASFQSVAFHVTGGCNLRCAHCYNRSGEDVVTDLSREQIFRVAEQIASLKPHNVCLCGGEPTCRKDLLEILDILRPYAAKLSMVTNGFAVDAVMASELVQHGLDVVQVSLDGAYAWQHDSLRGIQGAYSRAVNAIRYFRQAGVSQIMTSVLPNRLNVNSWEAYVKLCLGLQVDIIRAMPFLPSGRGCELGRPLMLDEEGYFCFRRDMWKMYTLYADRIRIEWDDPLTLIQDIAVSKGMGDSSSSLEIRADGQVALSSYLPILLGPCSGLQSQKQWQEVFRCACMDERVQNYVGKIHQIYDFDFLEPLPFGEEVIQLQLLEGVL